MRLKNRLNRLQRKQVIPRFGKVTRFDVGVPTPAPVRGPLEAELERLKARLLKPLLAQTNDPAEATPLRRAASEAASLAWMTPFPLLFFPALLEEKVEAAQRREARQRLIRRQTQNLLEQAVTVA